MNTNKKLVLIAFIIATVCAIFVLPSAFVSPAFSKANTDGGNDADRGYTHYPSSVSTTDLSDDEIENVNVSVIDYNGNDQSTYDQSTDDPYEVGWN